MTQISSRSYINLPCRLTFIAALEDSGTPFSYFPVMIPQARGDQDTTPTPTRHHRKKAEIKHDFISISDWVANI